MKILSYCFICSLLLVMYSCDQGDIRVENTFQTSLDVGVNSIADSINQLNDYYFKDTPPTRSTIGSIVVAYITKVVWADAVAAVKTWIGLKKGDAAKNASTASVNAAVKGVTKVIDILRELLGHHHSSRSSVFYISNILCDTISHDSLRLSTQFNNTGIQYLDYLGEYHNNIIRELFETHNTFQHWDTLTISNIHSSVIQSQTYLGFKNNFSNTLFPTDSLSISELIFIDRLQRIMEESTDGLDFLNNISENDSDINDILNILTGYNIGLNQYISGYITTSSFRNYSIQVYNTIYDSNNLPSLYKEALCSCITIAYASSLLWSHDSSDYTEAEEEETI